MAGKKWKTVRVVVEVPVCGDYSNEKFKRDMESELEGLATWMTDPPPQGPRFGAVRVKTFHRYVQYAGREKKEKVT